MNRVDSSLCLLYRKSTIPTRKAYKISVSMIESAQTRSNNFVFASDDPINVSIKGMCPEMFSIIFIYALNVHRAWPLKVKKT